MPRTPRLNGNSAGPALSAMVGDAQNAMRFTVNVSEEIGTILRQIAFDNQVSESSVIEISLRQLFRRVNAPQLGAFLVQHGACLRRRS